MNSAFTAWDHVKESSDDKYQNSYRAVPQDDSAGFEISSSVVGIHNGQSGGQQTHTRHSNESVAITTLDSHQNSYPMQQSKSADGFPARVTPSRNGRAVSATKRAAQNRNAQRAFRERKDLYVKELEAKAAEVDKLRQTIEELRNENSHLRDYTIALQSRVIELSPQSQSSIPSNSMTTIIPPIVDHNSSSVVMPPPMFNRQQYQSER
ncbi:hypothetical protein JA1_000619 [Spathaspora sp. JA1]|nr:hypothetical protein JA1_000619 [Spathaspora sp. JA1]